MKMILLNFIIAMAAVQGPPIEVHRGVKVPKQIVNEVQKIFKEIHFDEHNAVDSATELADVPREDLDLKIYFKEKTPHILGGEDVVVAPPAGGGKIDLSFIQSRRGTFFWHIALAPRLPEGSKSVTKVYFLSQHSRQLRDDGPAIGIGCHKVADITSYFTKVLSHDPGEALNTSAQTHLGLLSGTYYFFVIDKLAVRIASLTMADPRFSEVSCDHK